MSIREEIIKAASCKLQPYQVPEWNKTVYFKELNVGERLALIDAIADEANEEKLLYVLAVLHIVCEEDGTRAFGLDEYDLVASMKGEFIVKLGREAARYNKLVGEAVEDAKKN